MDEKSIILFDGVCNLCNGFVNFLIKRDRKNNFLFGSLQSDQGKILLKNFNYADPELNTVILVENQQIFTRSTAVLKIFRKMGGLWPWAYGLIIFPRSFRDWVYKLVARNRYRMFGRKDSCMIPTPALKARFIG